jgi:hypothetical protein
MMSDDRLFEEAFRGELEMEHQEHPGFSILWEYATMHLESSLSEKISLHLASCARCTRELREIREEQGLLLENVSRLRSDPLQRFPLAWSLSLRFREGLRHLSQKIFAPRVFYRHVLVYVSVGVLILALNVWMNSQPRLLGTSKQNWWALWLIIPWGILLVLHGLRAFLRRH